MYTILKVPSLTRLTTREDLIIILLIPYISVVKKVSNALNAGLIMRLTYCLDILILLALYLSARVTTIRSKKIVGRTRLRLRRRLLLRRNAE